MQWSGTPESILEFWFADTATNPANRKRQYQLWHGSKPKTDARIAKLYGSLVDDVAAGRFDNWATVPCGRLALIIVLDQFPRNIFRGTSRAFRDDGIALGHCHAGLAAVQDQQLSIVERGFFYLPLAHSESIVEQKLSVKLFEQTVADSGPSDRPVAQTNLDFAQEHAEIIERFGRFPHRNPILGRESTSAELRYFTEGGKTFGQLPP